MIAVAGSRSQQPIAGREADAAAGVDLVLAANNAAGRPLAVRAVVRAPRLL
jgi:hypothetical protein